VLRDKKVVGVFVRFRAPLPVVVAHAIFRLLCLMYLS
jgi:hypothetical protein